VVVPMVTSPLGGFLLGLAMMGIMFAVISKMSTMPGRMGRWARPKIMNRLFGKLQIVSAAGMGFMHGTNDAQKAMGIVALALAGGTAAGALDNVPDWLSFLAIHETGKDFEIPMWIALMCALVMAAGTAMGGWRIIKTLGHKMVKLHPIHGFAAETASATMIGIASSLGIPVSTTHNISCAIMGVGTAKRANAIKWSVVKRMVSAWVLTIPITGGLAYLLVKLSHAAGWISI
jgi:inorganic phosphate transporter, PiT family